jgi:arsenical pump membrane protein
VADLFVLVEAVGRTGVLATLSHTLSQAAQASVPSTASGAGLIAAGAGNLINNLPAGLLSGTAVQAAHGPPAITDAMLVGIDLGPNLSVPGSLATILWLAALRREGENVSARAFLKLGLLVMLPALLLVLAALLSISGS